MFRFVLLMVLFGNAICGQAQKTYEEVENEVISLYFDTLVPAYLDQRVESNPRSTGFKDAVIYVDSVLGDVSKMTYGGLFCAYIMEDPWGGMTGRFFAAGCRRQYFTGETLPFERIAVSTQTQLGTMVR